MSKISQLPDLAAPTGRERVPVIAADGQTRGAAIGGLVEAAAKPSIDRADLAAAQAAASAGDARGTARRMVITGDQFYAGMTRRFAYAVVDRYGRARAGLAGDGSLHAQRLTGPAGKGRWAFRVTNAYGRVGFGVDRQGAISGGASKHGFAFVVRNAYGRPGFAIGADGSVWTKDGLLGSIAAPARTSLVRLDAMLTMRMAAPDLIERTPGVGFSLLLLGDSQWRESWGGANVPLCRALYRRYGYGGPGFVALATGTGTDAGATRDQIVMTRSAGWTETAGVAWSPTGMGMLANAAGVTVALAYDGSATISTVRLLHGGGDPITYAYNGGTETTVDVGATAGFVDLPAPPGRAFTLTLKTTGTTRLAGPVFRASSGVVVHNAAIGGYATATYLGLDQTGWRATLARLGGVDAALIGLAGNDEASDVSPDTFEARARTLIGALRSLAAGLSIGWIVRPQAPRTDVPERMAAYADRIRTKVGPDLHVALLDAQPRFGATYADYGYGSAKNPLFQADLVHVNRRGANVLGGAAAELLFA